VNPLRLLVAGASAVDAGKTTFSVGLCEYTGAVGLKPRAGNGYWHDHDDYRAAVSEGRLYGKDARRLAAVSGREPEAINPIHRLWTPAPGAGTGLLGREARAFVVDRVVPEIDPRSDRTSAATYVRNGRVELPASAGEGLPLAGARSVSDLEAFNRVMEQVHAPALSTFADRLPDRAVVESYADVADPLCGVEPHAVAVVEPGRARIHDGRRYANAREVAGGSAREGRLEERVDRVESLLNPLDRVDLPALPSARRTAPGAVADAYETAFAALRRAAEAAGSRQ
jgi:predicted P-loop ATPase/GTPase